MARNGVYTNGDEVRRLRNLKGLTQEEMAKKADMGKGTIERAEQGVKPLTITSVRTLANYFGVKISTLLRDAPSLPSGENLTACTSEDLEDAQLRLEIKKTGKRVEVTLSGTLAALTEESLAAAMDHIRSAAKGDGRYIQILTLLEGSVKLVLQMTEEQARELERVVNSGALKEVGIVHARLLSEAKRIASEGATHVSSNWFREQMIFWEAEPKHQVSIDTSMSFEDFGKQLQNARFFSRLQSLFGLIDEIRSETYGKNGCVSLLLHIGEADMERLRHACRALISIPSDLPVVRVYTNTGEMLFDSMRMPQGPGRGGSALRPDDSQHAKKDDDSASGK